MKTRSSSYGHELVCQCCERYLPEPCIWLDCLPYCSEKCAATHTPPPKALMREPLSP